MPQIADFMPVYTPEPQESGEGIRIIEVSRTEFTLIMKILARDIKRDSKFWGKIAYQGKEYKRALILENSPIMPDTAKTP